MSRFVRQSFLGADSETRLDAATIGVVGLGGGGSHEVQQFAHLGIGGYVVTDPDDIDDTNSNRLVGGTLRDVAVCWPKYKIARRVIRGLQPRARIVAVPKKWQDVTDALKVCSIIMGAVDGFAEREELERFARRHLIPYIDIGMDVYELGKDEHLISGQVVLSMPGLPCLRCCGVITDERLTAEARKYGAAGGRPQVVWSNGVLASTAVGLAVQLLTPWHPRPLEFTFLEYDGNRGTVSVSAHVAALKGHVCPHHPPEETGDPLFDIRKHLKGVEERARPVPFWRRIARALTR